MSSRGNRGGGAAGWEGGHAVAEVVVGVEGCEERLFIGGIRRWRERRGGGWPAGIPITPRC